MGFRTVYGRQWSENGWRMCDAAECDNALIPGTGLRLPFRRGDAQTVLTAWAAWFHANVESLNNPGRGYTDEGSFTWTNSVASSNHLSGTACFAGDVDIITRQGPRPIGELAGQQVELLTADPFAGGRARWVSAPVSSFGHQQTHALTLSRHGRSKTVRVTADHRWFVRRVRQIAYQSNGRKRSAQRERVEEVLTSELRPGDALITIKRDIENGSYAPGFDYSLRFERATLDAALFVRSDQRERFGEAERSPSRWKVVSVSEAITEEVFCASVEGSRTFLLDDFILTGNCDLNWSNHAFQVSYSGFTQAEIARVRQGLNLFRGCIWWGQDWTSPKDSMHFQLHYPEGDGRITALAKDLRGGYLGIYTKTGPAVTPAPTPAGATDLLQYGSNGPAVTALQAGFNKVFPSYPGLPLAVDGDFGPRTQAAVREFQRRVGLDPDGIVGPLTRAQLAKYGIKV